MIAPAWFILMLLICNLGAAVTFAWQREWPWAVIYGSAAGIQLGCWWLTR